MWLEEEVQMLVELGELTRSTTPFFLELADTMNHTNMSLSLSTDIDPVEYELSVERATENCRM